MPTPYLEVPIDRKLADVLRGARQSLHSQGEHPRRDAEVLLRGVLGCDRSYLYAHAEQILTAEQARAFQNLINRRAAGEPVAYLLGTREFWSLDLTVSAATLIPRPDTEVLVERALLCIPPNAALDIADLGTGSGAIALAIARERPRCRVIATDISEAALCVARGNAARLGINNVEFRGGDWCAALGDARCAVIVTNPPYIPEGDRHLTEGDVRFEPRAALTSGPDGLAAIRHIIAQAQASLDAGGHLLLEHGYDQSERVQNLLRRRGYREIAAFPDLSGHTRVAQGQI